MVFIRYLFIMVFVASISMACAVVTTDYSWDQLDQSFEQTIKVPLSGTAVLSVNVPAELLEKKEKLTFRMVLATPFRTESDLWSISTSGFEGFRPLIAVNGGVFSGVYPIRFKFADGVNRSNAYVKVKSKHLHPGMNRFAFNADRRMDFRFSCGGDGINCTAIYVHKLWLEQ